MEYMKENGYVERIAYIISPQMKRGSYTELKKQAKALTVCHAKIEEQAGKGRLYLWAKKVCCENILGRRFYSLDELFSLQINNLSRMNGNLGNIINESRLELGKLEKYHDCIRSELAHDVSRVGEGRESLEKRISEYHKQLDDSIYDNESVCNMDDKALKRKILEDFHAYSLMNEKIADSAEEAGFTDRLEDLLRISIHTCERINLKAVRMERHLRNTKKAYESLKRQQHAISSLNGSIVKLGEFTRQVHSILGEGMERMSLISDSSDSFYSQGNESITDMFKGSLKSSYSNAGKYNEKVRRIIEEN